VAKPRKKGRLTEAELATYGIPPKLKTRSAVLKRPSEKKVVSITRSQNTPEGLCHKP